MLDRIAGPKKCDLDLLSALLKSEAFVQFVTER